MSMENPFNNTQETAQPNMEEQKPENPDVLPTTEGATEQIVFTPEQIEEARQEMEEELLERKKLEIVSAAALDSFNEDVKKMIVAINQSLGGRAESVDVWEGMRTQLARSARQGLSEAIDKTKKEASPNSMLVGIVEAINQDVFAGPQQSIKIPEAIDKNPGANLAGYIKEYGAELTGNELEEVEEALRIVSLNAQHKFFSWQNRDQLENVIAAQEELSRLNDEFDPARAGFFELKQAVENALASIRLDLNSKPNYKYACPEYALRAANCSHMLEGLSRVEAIQFLKDNDIELEEKTE